MKNALGRGLGVVLAATAALAHAEEPIIQAQPGLTDGVNDDLARHTRILARVMVLEREV